MSTRLELRTLLNTEIKIDPNNKIWSESAKNNYIDSAYFQLQKDWNFEWRENDANNTQSTVVWTQEYTLPTDFIRTELVRYNWTEIHPRSKTQLKRENATFVSWTPSRYYLYSSNIWFDVLPNAVLTLDIDYRKKLTKFTADTDSSEFPEDFDDAIVKYAAYLAWSSPRGNEQTSRAKLQEYQLIRDTLMNAYIYDIGNLNFTTQRSSWTDYRADVLSR